MRKDGRTFSVSGTGPMNEIILTDDGSDIRSLPAGGRLRIEERTGPATRIRFEARSVNGKIERTWSGLNGDAERRKWLADRLGEVARGSGFGRR